MTKATPQRPPRPFESVLLDAGWQPTKSVLFIFWIWEITETVWVSPYTARAHPLQTALRIWARNEAARKILAWAWEFRQRAKVKAGEELEFENVLGI